MLKVNQMPRFHFVSCGLGIKFISPCVIYNQCSQIAFVTRASGLFYSGVVCLPLSYVSKIGFIQTYWFVVKFNANNKLLQITPEVEVYQNEHLSQQVIHLRFTKMMCCCTSFSVSVNVYLSVTLCEIPDNWQILPICSKMGQATLQ